MNPTVLFWSRNADHFLWFDHILGKEGFKSKLVDAQSLLPAIRENETFSILFDAEEQTAEVCNLCEAIKNDKKNAFLPLIAMIPAGNDDLYLDLLKAGIDECFVRPLSPARILSYLNTLIDNPMQMGSVSDLKSEMALRKFHEITLDATKREVEFNGKISQLGLIEFKLLSRLIDAPGRVFSRNELIRAGWPPNQYVQSRTVDVHMGHLRRLLTKLLNKPVIRTVRSNGYALEWD